MSNSEGSVSEIYLIKIYLHMTGSHERLVDFAITSV
jgi:hypothetical protein